ncbi:MAG: type II toxin-antitoxin system RelE/ParE family toxin [Betaproteobacteria bacterium]|nr:type II toxin-antitoxin system RelE/ParE family toxin [Betaproteobacteria bacterium]
MPGRALRRLEFARRAALDLLAIDAYIARDNPKAATAVVEYVLQQADLLLRHPFTGKPTKPGAPRKLVLTRYPYNIHYRVTATKIRIVRVLHQARRIA